MSTIINGTTIYKQKEGATVAYPTICLATSHKEMFNNGFWLGDNPLDFVLPVFIAQTVVIFFSCRLVYFALRPLRQPKLVCYVLAGFILGPSILGRIEIFQQKMFPVKELVVFNTLASLVTLYYTFIAAVKIDTSMLLRVARDAWTIGVSGFLFPMVVATLLVSTLRVRIPGFCGTNPTAFISALFSTSFLTVIAHHMKEYDLITSEFSQLAMSSAFIEEIIFLVIAPVAKNLFTHANIFLGFQAMIPLVAIVLVATYILRPAILWIIKKTPEGRPVHQTYVIAILLGVLIMGIVTDLMGATIIFGAAIMGFIIPDGSSIAAAIAERSELIMMELFMPFFFVQIGYLTNVYTIKNIDNFALLLLFTLMIYSAKIVGIIFTSLFLNISFRNAILLGICMNIKGVVEFALFRIWLTINSIDEQSFTTLVLCNLFCTGIFGPLVDILHKPHVRLKSDASKKPRILQSTARDAELHILSCIHGEDNVHSMITLYETFNPKRSSPICIYVMHVIELIGQASPLLVPYNKHRRRFKPHKSDQIMHAFMNYSENSGGTVTIQPFALIAPYKTMDNIICNFVEDRNIPLIIVPFNGNQDFDQIKKTLLKSFNAKLQAHATCTVGILVDRGLRLQMHANNFFCNVVAIFLGGCDCREALTLAIRMSGNPSVSITTLKIVLKDNNNNVHINETERQLDDLLVKEFKDKCANNTNAVFREVTADNRIHVMDAIRSLENKYDLVILGRKWGIETEMVDWVEHLELGVLGDVLASSDYKGRMSVLVMQQCALVDA